MAKIQLLKNGQLLVTIPKRLAEFKGWKKSTYVKFLDHSQDSFVLEKGNSGVKVQQTSNGQLTITIPKRLAEFKQWKKGNRIKFRDHGRDSFILQKEVKE